MTLVSVGSKNPPKDDTQKVMPLTTLDVILEYIQKTGNLPRAACKVGNDTVILYKWYRHDNKLKLEFGIINVAGRVRTRKKKTT
jgi:hypothetical protein